MRRAHGVLLDGEGPAGGTWNLDVENRRAFSAKGPGAVSAPRSFRPDAATRAVLDLAGRRFPGHPGSLERFDWPVTPRQARLALEDFVERRLADFGTYQDAMWTGEPYLYHARIAAVSSVAPSPPAP